MSSGFRGIRGDVESGFAGIVPDQRHALRIHGAARPNNTNSFAFLFTVFLLFMILNSNQISPNFLVWVVFGVFLVAAIFRIYEICRQIQVQAAQVRAGGSSDALQGQSELPLPSSLAIAARGGLQGLRLQLALLGRNFDELEFETLGVVDSYNVSPGPSMSEDEINALPVHKYRATSQESEGSLQQQSSSSPAAESNQVHDEAQASVEAPEDELTCSVCLEQVNEGEIIRTLPCLHQFHSNCIDPWLRQQGTCPVCKFKAHEWQENDVNTGVYDGSPMV
ncbi:hypothetical protein MKW94_023148 [Papaver nudicaule]|uniref:RING-type E3 ubiquitin transferase n=1 Tax=Papaver nudicaule TaxID=74823 RepID=A0AA41UZ13_PAPNU|nr:hypothetical protein [Papaver nudicaule]